MADYMPTTRMVRNCYAQHFAAPTAFDLLAENEADFDRWLAGHDRQVLGRVVTTAPTLATEAAHALSVSAEQVEAARVVLRKHGFHVVNVIDERDVVRKALLAALGITVTGGEGRG